MLDKIKAKKAAQVHKKFGLGKKLVDKEVHEHEKHMHPGKPLTKLKEGGRMHEKKSHKRMDKLARGGKHKGGTKVNVIVAPQNKPMGSAPMGGAAPNAPMPMPAGAPPMLPPGGATPPMKKGGRKYKAGGSIGEGMTAGALGGEGRKEKIKLHRKHKK